jgi:putative hydrolase of HD superfamily
MEERFKSALQFYLLATQLKNKVRSGWDENHWHISLKRIESVAEHVYGTCILAMGLYSEFEMDLDLLKILKMLVLHEIGEVIIGDITPFDNISAEEKLQIEHEAMDCVLGDLIVKDEYKALLVEFDEKKTIEAKFAFHCDKMEADLQSKFYQDAGGHSPLDKQENNVVFGSQKVQQMLKDGAKTAFDIWYNWDKPLYQDDERFSMLLDYVKNIDTSKIAKRV